MTTAPPLLDLKAAALEYAARGWRVVPLHSLTDGVCSCGRGNCSSGGKHPRIKDWPRNASSDAAQIAEWWEKWPAANVGIALGTLSGLVGVDVDSEHAEAKLLEMAGNEGLPATLEMTTSAGKRRLLFAIPDSLETEPVTTPIPLPGGELRLQ